MLYNIFLATKNTKYTKDYGEVKRHKGKSFGFFLRESNDEVGIVSFSKSLFTALSIDFRRVSMDFKYKSDLSLIFIIYPKSASLTLRIAEFLKKDFVTI